MDFDDILGGGGEDSNPPAPEGRHFRSLKRAFVHDLDRGVTVTWLMQAFTMPRKKVETLLATCPPQRVGANNARIYDFREAVPYLVKPKVNVKKYIESLDPKDLPEHLKNEYWSARIKEQKARLYARDLWRSEDVVTAMSDILKLIKDTAILWTDSIDETTGITDPQREVLDNLVRDLLGQVGDTVANYCSGRNTPSQESDFDEDDEL